MAEHDNSEQDDLSPQEQRALFWKRLEGLNAGMLGLTRDMKVVPMSHNADEGAGALWFITAAGTHLVEACAAGPQDAVHVIADSGGKLYARLHGQLALVQDEAKLDEIWNPVAASWFEDGRDDPDVRLLKLSLREGEAWTTTNSAGFLFELARNKLTGRAPDMGEHFVLTF